MKKIFLGLFLVSFLSAACVVQQQPIEFSPGSSPHIFSYEGIQITFDYAGAISVKNFNWDPIRIEIYRLGGPLGLTPIRLFDRTVWRNYPETESGLWLKRGHSIKIIIHFPGNEYPLYTTLR